VETCGPDKWLVESGGCRYEAVLGVGHFAKPQVLRAAQEAAVRRLWEGAAEHCCGKGLEEGPPSLRAAKAATSDFIKEEKYLEAAAVEFVATGTHRERNPGGEGGEGGAAKNEDFCTRCGGRSLNTPKHQAWECPANGEMTDERVATTERWKGQALEEWDKWSFLWGRGIIPASKLGSAARPDIGEVKTWTTEGFKELAAGASCGHTDGSGGKEKVPAELTKVGFGAAVFEEVEDGPVGMAAAGPSSQLLEALGRPGLDLAEVGPGCVA